MGTFLLQSVGSAFQCYCSTQTRFIRSLRGRQGRGSELPPIRLAHVPKKLAASWVMGKNMGTGSCVLLLLVKEKRGGPRWARGITRSGVLLCSANSFPHRFVPLSSRTNQCNKDPMILWITGYRIQYCSLLVTWHCRQTSRDAAQKEETKWTHTQRVE
jgi:hypothetical protein